MDEHSPDRIPISEFTQDPHAYLRRVRAGKAITLTDGDEPVVRVAPINSDRDRLAALIEAGLVYAPLVSDTALPEPIRAAGTVSDLIERR